MLGIDDAVVVAARLWSAGEVFELNIRVFVVFDFSADCVFKRVAISVWESRIKVISIARGVNRVFWYRVHIGCAIAGKILAPFNRRSTSGTLDLSIVGLGVMAVLLKIEL